MSNTFPRSVSSTVNIKEEEEEKSLFQLCHVIFHAKYRERVIIHLPVVHVCINDLFS